MRMLTVLLAIVTGIYSTCGLANPAKEMQVHEYSLPNGLQLFVKEDHRAPVVVSQVWYKVGSAYENRGITGISHVVEHMMFKGTKLHGVGEFSKIVAAHGGKHNAFTSNDFTAFYQIFSSDNFPVSFQLESDRMQSLTIDPKEFKKEIQVVMEERRMRTDDNPNTLTYERFRAAAFVSSPYHIPVIGWMDDLVNMKAQDVASWYHSWYGPNNAVLVVVGDVKPDDVYNMAKKYFGPLKSVPVNKIPNRYNLEPLGRREVVVKVPAKLPWMIMGYNTPSLLTVSADQEVEPYALEVLAAILDKGNSARLSKDVVKDQRIATSASAGYSLFSLYDDLFTLSGTPATGHTVNDLRDAFLAQVKRLQTELINKDELDRVKAQIIAERIYDKDSMENQALEIGALESVGLSWHLINEYVARIEKITPEQLQAVAKKYLVDDRLTVGILDPLPIDLTKQKPVNMEGDSHHVR